MRDILEILENGRIDWSDEHQITTTIVTKNERLAIAEIKKLRARIAELEAALKPLEKAWLFPDDLGEEASAIIRSEPDWNEEENDRAREDVIVCRQEIRKARAALKGEA